MNHLHFCCTQHEHLVPSCGLVWGGVKAATAASAEVPYLLFPKTAGIHSFQAGGASV